MNIDFYEKNILFRDMSRQDIEDALDCLNVYKRSYHKGEQIYRAGSSTSFIGLIYKGSVIVERNDLWGNRSILTSFSEGDFFGEAYAFNPDAVIPVDIIANEETTVFFLEVGRIASHSCNAPRITHKLVVNLLQISLQKNMYLSNRSFLLSAHTMREKILGYLNTAALQNRSREFDIPFDRQQLADFLNIERSALSKELSKMQKEGIIEYRKNHFRLLLSDDDIFI